MNEGMGGLGWGRGTEIERSRWEWEEGGRLCWKNNNGGGGGVAGSNSFPTNFYNTNYI